MSPRPATLVLLLLVACGADNASTAGPAANPTPNTPATPSAGSYELHEWGLLTVSASGTQVTAGPMRQSDAMIVVEKPVIYLHTSSALDLAIQGARSEVAVGAGSGAEGQVYVEGPGGEAGQGQGREEGFRGGKGFHGQLLWVVRRLAANLCMYHCIPGSAWRSSRDQ